MYRPTDPAPQTGLYRCTTCGIMVPFSVGELLSSCPNGCLDPIWSFFHEHGAENLVTAFTSAPRFVRR